MIPINFCACMGPRFNQPYCPCEMQRRGLSDGKEYAWSDEDKARLKAALEKMFEAEQKMIEITDAVPVPVNLLDRKPVDAPKGIIVIEDIPLPEEQRAHKMDRGLKKIVQRYKAAYQKIYGVLPHIEYSKPWLTVTGHDGRVSRQRLLEMARQLEYRAG